MFWIIGGFTILAAWAILSIVGGERQRLLQEMRTKLAMMPAATAAADVVAPAAGAAPKIAAKPGGKQATRPVRPNRPGNAAPAKAGAPVKK